MNTKYKKWYQLCQYKSCQIFGNFSESKEYNNHLKLLNIKGTFRQFLTWWTFGPCHNGLWEWYERKKLTIFYTFILGVISTSEPLCAAHSLPATHAHHKEEDESQWYLCCKGPGFASSLGHKDGANRGWGEWWVESHAQPVLRRRWIRTRGIDPNGLEIML